MSDNFEKDIYTNPCTDCIWKYQNKCSQCIHRKKNFYRPMEIMSYPRRVQYPLIDITWNVNRIIS